MSGRSTIHVPEPRWKDFEPRERIEVFSHDVDQRAGSIAISSRWATVVSWDEATGELVVEYDPPSSVARPELVGWHR